MAKKSWMVGWVGGRGAEECTIKSQLHQNTVTLPDSLIFQPVHPRKDNGHVWSCLPQPIELLAKGTDLSFAQPHAGQGKGRGVAGGVAGWEGQVKGQGAKVTQVKWPCPALTCTKHENKQIVKAHNNKPTSCVHLVHSYVWIEPLLMCISCINCLLNCGFMSLSWCTSCVLRYVH